MSGMLGIGTTALNAYQRALATTSHNVSNANTPGYSRQRVELSSREPTYQGGSYIGNGVASGNTVRSYDAFLAGQVRASQSAAADLEVYHQYTSQIDQITANPSTGLNPTLQSFFDAVHGLANDPSATPARDLLLADGQALADRFHFLDRALTSATQRVHSDLEQAVEQVNNLANTIAQLNQSIASAPGRTQGRLPNDLLDQREQALTELSRYVTVSTLDVDDGTVNVYLGKGQSLIQGVAANQLVVLDSPELPNHKEIAFSNGKAQSIISDQLTGGELGGLLRVRDEVLDEGRNDLGLVALGLSFEINAQHRAGLNLDQQTGVDFFSDLSLSASRANTLNAAATDYAFSMEVTNPSLLAASEIRLTFNGGAVDDLSNYTLTRVSDGQVLTPTPPPAGFPWDLSADLGVRILSAGTAISAGDSFVFDPISNAAKQIEMAIHDPQSIAAASPMEPLADGANVGSGQLSLPRILDPTSIPVVLPGSPPALQLQYLDDLSTVVPPPATGPLAGPGYVFTGGPAGTATFAYDPALDGALGKTLTLDLGTFSLEIMATGQPTDGDSFTLVNGTQARVSDNRNALLMADLQNWRGMLDGTATMQDTFGNSAARIGARTQQANVNLQAQNKMLEVNKESLEAVKGVNLDEEAANLIRFQQAYQAAAKVIATAGTVFDSLLAVI